MNITAKILRDKVHALHTTGDTENSAHIRISASEALYIADLLDMLADNLASSSVSAFQTMASLNLTSRTASKLYACKINTMGDLLRYSEYDLARLPQLDNQAFSELIQKMRTAGIFLQRI